MRNNPMLKRIVLAALLIGLGGQALADTAAPAPPPRPLRGGGMFPMQGGQAIYQGVCQGCHMPNAKGAVGAGMYPALANDAKLEEAGYPLGVILSGQKAMPPLGALLTDAQIADVVNYIRTHFGNRYSDKVTPDLVKTMR